MFNIFKKKPKLTKEQIEKEIQDMIDIYNNPKTNPMMNYNSKGWYGGFLFGSSLCGNDVNNGGDSARFHELNKMLEDIKKTDEGE